MRKWLLPTSAALALSACSESDDHREVSAPAVDAAAESTSADFASEEYPADPALAARDPLPAGMPSSAMLTVCRIAPKPRGLAN